MDPAPVEPAAGPVPESAIDLGRPRVILHNAVSVDGRIDWFTPDLGQYYGLAATWNEDATLAGSETVRSAADDIPEPESFLEPREAVPGDTRPLLVIPDSRGVVRNWHALLGAGYWREGIALCSESTPAEHLRYLEQRHIATITAGRTNVDFRQALTLLRAAWAAEVVRVDSGGTLNGVLLREGLVDEISLLVYPSLVGGSSPRSSFRAPDLTTAEGVIPLTLHHVERLEGDAIWLRYSVGTGRPG
jgi:2,5-diamino-6-(ribosylamino)-4(3H)-pyrimidinone 5'-phosphate reductase